jgi:hypothetical protein
LRGFNMHHARGWFLRKDLVLLAASQSLLFASVRGRGSTFRSHEMEIPDLPIASATTSMSPRSEHLRTCSPAGCRKVKWLRVDGAMIACIVAVSPCLIARH